MIHECSYIKKESAIIIFEDCKLKYNFSQGIAHLM